jgi:hypothetical protein
MFGYDQGVLSSLLTLDSFAETFPQAGGSFSTLQSFMVAICTTSLTQLLTFLAENRSNRMHGWRFTQSVRW